MRSIGFQAVPQCRPSLDTERPRKPLLSKGVRGLHLGVPEGLQTLARRGAGAYRAGQPALISPSPPCGSSAVAEQCTTGNHSSHTSAMQEQERHTGHRITGKPQVRPDSQMHPYFRRLSLLRPALGVPLRRPPKGPRFRLPTLCSRYACVMLGCVPAAFFA